MMMTDSCYSAAQFCWEHKIPFVLYILPGSDIPEFWANPSFGKKEVSADKSFIIVPWLNNFEQAINIYKEVDSDHILEYGNYIAEPEPEPETKSTGYDEYIQNVSSIIDRLKQRGGKTVFSRTECGSTADIDILSFVKAQFKIFQNTFRFFYYTPITGAWVGTSPEILLELSFDSHQFRIMSLAGTKTDNDKLWDSKNIVEQNLVGKFIGDALDALSVEYKCTRCNDVNFKPVRHICDLFTGILNDDVQYQQLLDRLSPTPALGGYPKEDALNEIRLFESHQRRCYGGYVGIIDSKHLMTYVNLRCINFSSSTYCIYAGGGITAASDPASEWNETLKKTEILRLNLNNATF